jgi:Domain of unknown function (DUF6602)
MGRGRDNRPIDLRRVFLRVQEQMLASLAATKNFTHTTACGTASERHWIELLNQYLPQRYCAGSAFVIDADGQHSRQIDIAVYDRFYSPRLFYDSSQPYIPAESVYAVFEVKQALARMVVWDAARKAASVRRLRRTSVPIPSAGMQLPAKRPSPILAGILSLEAAPTDRGSALMASMIQNLGPEERLDLGCCLGQWAFEVTAGAEGASIYLRPREEALIFFMLRLIHRLQEMGPAPAIDFEAYGRWLG